MVNSKIRSRDFSSCLFFCVNLSNFFKKFSLSNFSASFFSSSKSFSFFCISFISSKRFCKSSFFSFKLGFSSLFNSSILFCSFCVLFSNISWYCFWRLINCLNSFLSCQSILALLFIFLEKSSKDLLIFSVFLVDFLKSSKLCFCSLRTSWFNSLSVLFL